MWRARVGTSKKSFRAIAIWKYKNEDDIDRFPLKKAPKQF
jgi:hypothetical protein